MFDRKNLKELAKQRMHGARGNAIVVVLLTTLLGTLFSGSIDVESEVENLKEQWGSFGSPATFESILPILSAALLFGLAYNIFVGGIIDIGCRGWFLRYWRGEYPSVGELFASFRIYLPSLKTNLLAKVYVWLWSFLFVIPGIVKGLAYSMAPYIIYENPNITANEAITMSRKMTDGAKGDLFVFGLSYFGWMLLNAFTFGILGIVYVHPYQCTAHAAIYDTLKTRAIQEGTLTWADFGQNAPYYDVFQM